MPTRIVSIFVLIVSLSFSLLQSKQVSPLDLVVPERADLMAKYIYAKHRAWETTCPFGKEVYYHHLKVWNDFWEDDPPKRTFTDYLVGFNSLLDSIKKRGFNRSFAVPVDKGGVISNGAHRVTACLLYHI